MFSSKSRYAGQSTYPVVTGRATVLSVLAGRPPVVAVTLPLPRSPMVRGLLQRAEGQRLDLIANYYLSDPTGFWRLCDASGTVAPDALAARELVAVPFKVG